jgi:hypothetical protein
MKKEESLQLAVCNYLRYQYPDVIFTCDLSSGMKLSIGQAVKAKKMKSSRGLPDMMIFEPNKNYNGLFLELKSKSPFKKSGELLQDEHLQEQVSILQRLTSNGYRAVFATGFDEAKKIIDQYLNDK